MNYIVFDLEFNGRKHYEIYPMEIIEIGAVKLNEQLEVVDTFQSYIRPKFHINKFALQFCGIDRETLINSDPFTEVIRRFAQFCGSEYKLLCWGGSDYFNLFVDSRVNGMDSNWLVHLLDVTSFFSGGLHKALEEHRLEPIGQHHSALDDAFNAVQLLKLKPEIFQSEQYFKKNEFKICTGGIKKWILMCIDEAVAKETILTWEQFSALDNTKTYFRIMRLNDEEIGMVKTLFFKFLKMKFGRKWKKLQLA
ncbi:3'-5' exonuclease [Paenibacillus hamazuiensis]|uniref:3'-5' exonuclease n=1 Tax=Paenibacillus hamazuiensis TaxID=2936508 RepID=UPI00200D4213|nr:3'-5' exonuclease [Paenibacillus hamazuiensis]